MIGDGFQIIGIMIHIMSVAGLSRATMSASIGRDDSITFGQKEQHLRVPIIRRKRPAVTEHDRLSAAPVFIIDFDILSIFFSCSYVWHDEFLSVWVAR